MKDRQSFKNHFGITDNSLRQIGDLFMRYGHPDGIDKSRSAGNHYFLQGIWQWQSVEYKTWRGKMTKELKEIIKLRFPQFMVQNRQFEDTEN